MDLIATKIKDTLFCYNLEERRLKTYRRRVHGPSIPDDLVYEILIRLPVRLSAAVSHKYHPPNEFYRASLNNFIL
jgi:hypothetical protein